MGNDAKLLFNWNNVFWGATVMLAKITNQGAYHQLVRCPPTERISDRARRLSPLGLADLDSQGIQTVLSRFVKCRVR